MSKGNGFLTGADRDFLNGEKEYTGKHAKQNRYKRREGIAKRTRAAFADFALLYDQLDESERNRIFDIEPYHEDRGQFLEFRDALASTIAFLYRSLKGDIDSDITRTRDFSISFEEVLTEGLKRGEADRYGREHATEARVTVNYDGVELLETGGPAQLERGIQKIAEHQHQELTEAEMASILFQFQPDGPTDAHTGEREGFARLDELIETRREELGIEPFGEYGDQ